MKKAVLIVLPLAIVGYILYALYLAPSDNFQSIYLVPKDAVYIIQTDQPVNSWKKVSSSKMWKHMQKQPYFGQLTASANALDSLILNNEQLFDILGSRSITVSAHVFKPRKYDFLFIVDLEKVSKLKFMKDYFTKIGGETYRITERKHQGHSIYELYDKSDKTTLYFSFIENLLVCSYVSQLVEASILEHGEPVIGRDIHFIEMKQGVSDGGLFTVYLQYNWLDELMRCYLAEDDEYINDLSKSLFYTGLNVKLQGDEGIAMKGYTNINDSVSSYMKALLLSGKGKLQAQEVIPRRTAFYMSIAVDKFSGFYDNFIGLLKENSKEYQEYEKNIDQIEKFLDISLKDNFISWIGNEVVFVQTQPKGLGRENELAVIIKAKDKSKAKENLDFIAKQIRKKTPVKFKEVNYKGYPINFLSVKGMFKAILGNFFKKLDKPYYTIIDDYVIFSNHPQTIKNIIDDNITKNTLAQSKEFMDFFDQFERSSNIFIYANTPTLYNNLKGYVSQETWVNVNKNKDYITCFPHIGFQMMEKRDMFETTFISSFNDGKKEEIPSVPVINAPVTIDHEHEQTGDAEATAEAEEEIDEIYMDDLDIKRHKENYEDGSLKLKVDIKNGVRNGSYFEYHPNGKLKVKGRYRDDLKDGIFRYYNEQGKLIEKRSYSKGVIDK